MHTETTPLLTLVDIQSILTFTPLFRPRRPQLPAEEISLLVFLVGIRDGHRLHADITSPWLQSLSANTLHVSARTSVPESTKHLK